MFSRYLISMNDLIWYVFEMLLHYKAHLMSPLKTFSQGLNEKKTSLCWFVVEVLVFIIVILVSVYVTGSKNAERQKTLRGRWGCSWSWCAGRTWSVLLSANSQHPGYTTVCSLCLSARFKQSLSLLLKHLLAKDRWKVYVDWHNMMWHTPTHHLTE